MPSPPAAQPGFPLSKPPPERGPGEPPEQPEDRSVWRLFGPGLVTGASDDDPSGIGTYAAAGASLGYSTLWTALVTFPLMAAIQYICAKVGLVTGRGLAGVLRRHYPKALLYPVVVVLLVANTINAGVDIGAIAAGINLLVPIPISILILPVTLSILVLQFWGSYRLIDGVFKWLTLALLAYIGSAFFAKPDWAEVLRGTVMPEIRLDTAFLTTLVAILGTTISPYLFFWQASHEVEEKKSLDLKRMWRRETGDRDLRYAFWDVNIGMFFSNVVMYFIILATAATLHQAGQTEINTAEEAAAALRPLAGEAASLLLTLGLVGAGFLAIPILTGSSAYAVSEALGWRSGLNRSPKHAPGFYAVIGLSTVAGMAINFIGVNPVRALFWTAVLNGLLAPPLLVVIMMISNNKSVMGERINSRALNLIGWLATGAMFAAALGLIVTWILG